MLFGGRVCILVQVMKAATIILIILTIGLGATLFYQHNKSVQIKAEDVKTIITLSNQLDKTTTKLQEQVQVGDELSKTLKDREIDLSKKSNELVKISAALVVEKQHVEAANAKITEMATSIAKKDKQISDYEAKQNDYTKKMEDLTLNMENLSKQIADTQKKLDASEGDREFLLKEMKRLQAEKAELERQFNDLSVLRTQVAKLKDELSIARRLEWIRMGIYGNNERHGADMLIKSMNDTTGSKNYNLNVELKNDGSAVVVPAQTNTPPPAPK